MKSALLIFITPINNLNSCEYESFPHPAQTYRRILHQAQAQSLQPTTNSLSIKQTLHFQIAQKDRAALTAQNDTESVLQGSLDGEALKQGKDGRSKHSIMQGMKAFREKNVVKALEIFKELRKNGDRSAELSYYLGSCNLNLGKHQSSIVFLN